MILEVTLTDISLFLIALAFFLLVVYLIPTVLQIKQTAETLNTILRDTEGELKGAGKTIQRFRERVERLIDVTDIIAGHLKGPVIGLVGFIAGMEYFFKHLKKDRKGGNDGTQ